MASLHPVSPCFIPITMCCVGDEEQCRRVPGLRICRNGIRGKEERVQIALKNNMFLPLLSAFSRLI